MKCRDIEPLVYLIRDGELSTEEIRELEAHLSSCEHCSKLYDSVIEMRTLLGQVDFSSGLQINGEKTAEAVMERLEGHRKLKVPVKVNSGMQVFFRTAAAALLLMIALTFTAQQWGFYMERSSFRLRLHQEALLNTSGIQEEDCVNRLKRKYVTRNRSAFARTGQLTFNTVNEDQLAQYITQVCGSGSGDINTLKKKLIEAGLLKEKNLN